MVILTNTTVSILRKSAMEVEAYQADSAAGYTVIASRVPASLVPGGGSSKVSEGTASEGSSGQQVRNYAILQVSTSQISYKDRVRDESTGAIWEVLTVAVMKWAPSILNYQRARLRLVEGEVS